MSDAAQELGQRLKAERERRGLSAQKMADDMHLDAWVIDALEAGDYQRIGPPVYARGHLRKYASILGVLAAEAAPGSEKRPAPAGPPLPTPIIRMDPPGRRDALWPKLTACAAILLVAAGLAWWRPWHRSAAPAAASKAARSIVPRSAAPLSAAANPTAPSPSAQDAAQPSAQPDSTAALASDASASDAPASDAPGADAPRIADNAAAATPSVTKSGPAQSPADLTPGVGRARLRLSFSADSRVDVFDYSGRPIFTGNGRANSVKALVGIAPFRVYLGFASGVQVQVNDRVVAIGPQFVTGDVARFEAGADGVLRRDSRPNPTNGTPTVAASPRG
jgi:cytoskeleton protein RodZ